MSLTCTPGTGLGTKSHPVWAQQMSELGEVWGADLFGLSHKEQWGAAVTVPGLPITLNQPKRGA